MDIAHYPGQSTHIGCSLCTGRGTESRPSLHPRLAASNSASGITSATEDSGDPQSYTQTRSKISRASRVYASQCSAIFTAHRVKWGRLHVLPGLPLKTPKHTHTKLTIEVNLLWLSTLYSQLFLSVKNIVIPLLATKKYATLEHTSSQKQGSLRTMTK